MERKRILFVTREIVPFYFGGIGSQFKAMGKLFRKHGHNVSFLTQRPSNFNSEVFRKNYPDIKLFFTDNPVCSLELDSHAAHAHRVSAKFDEIYERSAPDIVFLADFEAEGIILLVKANQYKYQNSRFILTINGMLSDTISVFESGMETPIDFEEYASHIRLRGAMEDMCVLLASEINTPTKIAWDEVKIRTGVRKDARIIPNLVDRELFDPEKDTGKHEQGKPLILFIGRLDRHKGADLLLKAYFEITRKLHSSLPDLVFIGRDRWWREYGKSFLDYWQEKIPGKYSEKITFLGQIDHDRVAEYIERAMVCVFPSRWEVFGIVCLEAMVLGCPVVVSKGTGLEEVVGKALSEYTVDVSANAFPLAEKLLQILENPSHYRNNSHRFKKRALELIVTGEQKTLELLDMPTGQSDEGKQQETCRQYMSTVGQLISQIWEDAENTHHRLSMNRFQIYTFQNGETSEARSIICYYPISKWFELKVEIPAEIDEGILRIDPSDRAGTIYIKNFSIQEKSTGSTVFRADGSNRFAGFTILKNGDYEYDNRRFIIHAKTEDPQILIRMPAVAGPIVMRATIYFRDEMINMKKGPRQLVRYLKGILTRKTAGCVSLLRPYFENPK